MRRVLPKPQERCSPSEPLFYRNYPGVDDLKAEGIYAFRVLQSGTVYILARPGQSFRWMRWSDPLRGGVHSNQSGDRRFRHSVPQQWFGSVTSAVEEVRLRGAHVVHFESMHEFIDNIGCVPRSAEQMNETTAKSTSDRC